MTFARSPQALNGCTLSPLSLLRTLKLVKILLFLNILLITSGLLIKLMRWDETWGMTEHLLMTSEHTAATYFSALQFVLAGMVGLVLLKPTRRVERLSLWIISVGIIFIGIDDALVIHERFGQQAGKHLLDFLEFRLTNAFIRPWMLIYVPVLLAGLVVASVFLRYLSPSSARSAAVAGMLAFALAILMEVLEKKLEDLPIWHALQVGIEESSELMGAWFFMLAFVLAANGRPLTHRGSVSRSDHGS